MKSAAALMPSDVSGCVCVRECVCVCVWGGAGLTRPPPPPTHPHPPTLTLPRHTHTHTLQWPWWWPRWLYWPWQRSDPYVGEQSRGCVRGRTGGRVCAFDRLCECKGSAAWMAVQRAGKACAVGQRAGLAASPPPFLPHHTPLTCAAGPSHPPTYPRPRTSHSPHPPTHPPTHAHPPPMQSSTWAPALAARLLWTRTSTQCGTRSSSSTARECGEAGAREQR